MRDHVVHYLTCLALVFAFAVVAVAQTPRLAWEMQASSAAEAAGLNYRLYTNNVAGGVPVPGVTCPTFAAGVASCQAPIPPGTPTTYDTKLELSAKTATGPEGPRSVPFISAPGAPINFRKE